MARINSDTFHRPVPVADFPLTPGRSTATGREEPKNAWNEIQDIALNIFDYMEKVLWKYAKEANNIAKRTIKVVSLACTELKGKLGTVVAKMGILSAISCLLSIKAIPSDVMSLIENIKLQDGEGIAFSVMQLIVDPIDALDSFITTMEALAAFEVVNTIAFFSLIGLPLAIGLVGYAAFRGLYKVITCSINLDALPKSIENGNIEDFKNYIEEKIGVTEKEREKVETKYRSKSGEEDDVAIQKKINREIKIIKDRKRNILTRHTDVKVYNIMKNMQEHLNKNSNDLRTANKGLRDLKRIMARKIASESIGLTCNLVFEATLIASMVFPISAFAIPVVAGARAGIAMGRLFYDQVLLDKGLELPKFAKIS